MKKIYIVRHAKSDWDNNLQDFDRPLNDRGHKDAPVMAGRIKGMGHIPELIVSSPAKRAITTAEYFAKEYDYPVNCIKEEKEIYFTGQRFTLNMLEELDDSLNSVMVFGHNPDHSYVAKYLSNQQIGNIPTCAVVGISLNTDKWSEIKKAESKLLFYEYPKKNKK